MNNGCILLYIHMLFQFQRCIHSNRFQLQWFQINGSDSPRQSWQSLNLELPIISGEEKFAGDYWIYLFGEKGRESISWFLIGERPYPSFPAWNRIRFISLSSRSTFLWPKIPAEIFIRTRWSRRRCFVESIFCFSNDFFGEGVDFCCCFPMDNPWKIERLEDVSAEIFQQSSSVCVWVVFLKHIKIRETFFVDFVAKLRLVDQTWLFGFVKLYPGWWAHLAGLITFSLDPFGNTPHFKSV